MKLSEYRGEAALDLLADIMDPVSEILQDEAFKKAASGWTVLNMAKAAIKGHKRAVIEILARMEGEEPDEYAGKINFLTLPKKVIEVLNDKDLREGFTSAGQTMESESSGSLMVITGDGEN